MKKAIGILVVKHLCLFALIVFLRNYIYDDLKQITIPTDTDRLNPHILLITVSGLLLAGAISGYFQISYSKAFLVEEYKIKRGLLLTAHIVTSLMLVVIGVLLVVCAFTLDAAIEFSRGITYKYAVVLYISLAFYDGYDYCSERSRHQEMHTIST